MDFFIEDLSKYDPAHRVHLSHTMHRRLTAEAGLEVVDHKPMCMRVRIRPWRAEKRQEVIGFDHVGMVRSCVRWDDKAVKYSEHARGYFTRGWLTEEAHAGRVATPGLE